MQPENSAAGASHAARATEPPSSPDPINNSKADSPATGPLATGPAATGPANAGLSGFTGFVNAGLIGFIGSEAMDLTGPTGPEDPVSLLGPEPPNTLSPTATGRPVKAPGGTPGAVGPDPTVAGRRPAAVGPFD
jgi:hypothetical protein